MTTKKPLVVVLDADELRSEAVRKALPDIGIEMELVLISAEEEMDAVIKGGAVDLVLCAADTDRHSVAGIKERLQKGGLNSPVVAFVDLVKTDSVVNLVNRGADDIADIHRTDHLTFVAARHLGALSELREHWKERQNAVAPAPQQSNGKQAKEESQPANDSPSPDEWRQKLNDAVNKRRFRLSRQTISNLRADDKHADREHIDILLRLRPEDDGPDISAGQFIQQATEAGLAPVIDAWVIHQVCQQLNQMRQQGLNPLCFTRLAPDTLERSSVGDFVASRLKQFDVPADNLSLEVPESALGDLSEDAWSHLRTLRELGCYLTFSHVSIRNPMQNWPPDVRPDYVKTDPVQLMRCSVGDDRDLRTFVDKMHAEKISIIAPQIEHADALAVVWRCGIDYAQGFYYSQPEVVMASE